MKRIRFLSLVLGMVCLLSVFSFSVAAESPKSIYTSLIYQSPSATSRTIGKMEDGTKVHVLEQVGEYYKIDCYDTDGYIAISQVQKNAEGEHYILCEPESNHTSAMEIRGIGEAVLLRSIILELAKGQLGDPYVYGATGPNAFDCSGFTSYLYKNNGYSMERVCSGQMGQGLIVSQEGLQVGDLILFGSSMGDVSHVAVYAGDGQIIHAGSKGICYADLDNPWFAQRYLCARRIITVGDQITRLTTTAAADLSVRQIGTSVRSVG